MNLEGFTYADIDITGELGTADRWILHRMNETAREITRLMDAYEFGETGRVLNNFIWDDLCDWYIEFAKLSLYGSNEQAKKKTQSVLAYVLDHTMRMIHPFMPYISEEIWQHLPHSGETVTLAEWPVYRAEFEAPEAVREMTLLMDMIRAVRNIRAEVNVPMSKKVELIVKPTDRMVEANITNNLEFVERFCGTSKLEVSIEAAAPNKAMTAIVTGAELYLPLAGLLDIDQEIARLQKEVEHLNKEVERVDKKLANQGFIAKAPASVIDEERAKQRDYSEKRDKVLARITELKEA